MIGVEATFDYDYDVVHMGDNEKIFVSPDFKLLSENDKDKLSKYIDEFIKSHL